MNCPRSGFSYIELLISTAIVLVLYMITLGPNSKFAQTRTKTQCARNLQQLHMTFSLYAGEHEGALPISAGAKTSDEPLSLLVPLYTTDTTLFICPGSKDPALPSAQPFAGKQISYAYYMGLTRDGDPLSPLASDRQINEKPKRAGEPVFSVSGRAPGDNHRKYGGNVVFLDGHVETGESAAKRDLPVPRGVVLLNPRR
jgi:prepilin-type processing-associated H-X9-DG protein